MHFIFTIEMRIINQIHDILLHRPTTIMLENSGIFRGVILVSLHVCVTIIYWRTHAMQLAHNRLYTLHYSV